MSSALSTFSQSTAITSPTINIMTKIGSFSLYRSQATGLEVTFVDVDTPIVNGLAAIATEEANELIDGGRPHTLEHLIFLGSEDFPYKGVLDTLANRARARGTNAWTAQDSTVYTITTAGANGFAKILPIYLDHVLYPTMTDAGFVTEVYHVNGEGQDGGVVYSEMQGRENGPGDLTWHRMGQLMYPAPSGYASETGGLMRKLRELTIDEIRKYHARYYRPDNLCLIVTGKVDHAKLLDRLEQTEAKIKSKGELPKVDRPWVNSPIAPLTKSVSEVVPFPDEDESKGNLFVECEDPVATSVSDYTNNYKETSSVLYFSSVPTDKLGDLEHKVQEVLAAHTIDIERMHTVLEQRRLRIQNGVESDPGMAMAHSIITHFLYGDRETAKDLIDFVDEEHIFKHLTAMTKDQWQELLQTKLVNAPRIALQAKPSAQLAKDLAAQEAARVAERQKNPEQLKKYQETLDAAMKANDMPIPPEVISNFEVPPMDANLPNVLTAQLPAGRFQNELQAKLDALPATAKLPFFVQLDQVQSQFIGSRLAIDTTHLSGDLRKYLGVYLELVFASPVTLADGSKLTHEQVVAGLNQDTIHFNAGCGAVGESSGSSFSGGAFESQISLWIRSTPEKYAKAVQWIHTVVKHLEFDYGRLATVIRNMLGNVPALKREAMRMASWAIKSTVYDAATSNHAALALNNQVPFLKQLLERVEAKDARVVEDLKALSAALFKPANVRLHLSGAVAKVGVQPALEAWQGIVAAKDGQVAVSVPAKPTREFLNAVGQNPNSKNGRGKLINIPSNESGYLVTLTRGPASNEHPDYPAVMVALRCSKPLKPSGVRATLSRIWRPRAHRSHTMSRSLPMACTTPPMTRYNAWLLEQIDKVSMADVVRVAKQYMPNMFSPDTALFVGVTGPSKVDETVKGFEALGVKLEVTKVDE
ncbi:hypothetical protein BCR44DRAFT_1423978 [Catenaria anguillulae PL171]|uniref:Peptidase M16 C-terminal domain-containing protein n=1 Tax=Catenaria anguillulae PL171 TaxID=765915 RepID=A0A1Y2I1Z2_9FUNG|nr:hypothetical protein BCR44DRAFT_1423978 [Catenaria anguillulae PL171]